MKQYFSRITANHWTPKNRAQKEAHEVVNIMDRRIISENQVEKFTEEFKNHIGRVNQDNKRCTPLHLSVWEIPNSEDINFNISGVFSLDLFLVKGEG